MATKVRVRTKPISDNRESLYLDFYPPIIHPETGKPTRRHFLGRFLYAPIETVERKSKGGVKKIHKFDTNPSEHDKKETHNSEQSTYADQVRSQWERKLNANEALSDLERRMLDKDKKEREIGDRNFVDYFQSLANKRKASNHDNWVSAYAYLKNYTGGVLRFADINERWCNGFKDFLLTTKSNKSQKSTLSQNSAVSYFNKIKASLKQAFKDGYLNVDLNARIEPIKQAETRRNFLTIEELNSLIKTECQNPLLKKAAIFSAMTGLRFSDIQNLKWGDIEIIEDRAYLNFTQKKTKSVETLPLSNQAYEFLGPKKEPKSTVFDGLTYSAYSNKHLYQWIGAAGITKDITFHCFRHSHATLLLENNNVKITTIQKLLGHKDLKTTMIYAKVVDKSKREAVDSIKLDL